MPISSLRSYLSVDRVSNVVLDQLSPEFMLNAWLNAHPKVAKAIVYEGEHFSGEWTTWPESLRKQLADHWETMLKWYGQGMPTPDPAPFKDPIPRDATGDPMWGSGLVMPKERGRHVYLSHVANGLALEMSGKLPWSITGYSSAHLKELFSMDEWMFYLDAASSTYPGYYFEELMSPAPPAHVMRFFKANDLIGMAARDTVARLFG